MAEPTSLRFYFDPGCPWAWRTSLWIREVTKVRSLDVEWDFLSLQAVNQGKDSLKAAHFKSEKGFRIMALLRRKYSPAEANQLIDKLYLELGHATHTRKEDISEDAIVLTALKNIGLDESILTEAMSDSTTLDDVLASHNKIVEQGGFGVPTLVLQNTGGTSKPAFGPVIDQVPEGDDAGELWDHIEYMMQRKDFFELKRSR